MSIILTFIKMEIGMNRDVNIWENTDMKYLDEKENITKYLLHKDTK